MSDSPKPKFFTLGFISGGLTNLSSALAVSINTLLVAFGASAFNIGLISSLHFVGQIFSQFYGLKFLNLFKSRKYSQVLSMIPDTLPHLIFAVIAFTQFKYWFVAVALAVFLSGLAGRGSYLCWFSWMDSIVPNKFKNYFFSVRSLVGNVSGIAGFLVAFFVLKFSPPTLLLLSVLYLSSFMVSNLEMGTYLFYPDSARERLIKNNILARMKKTLSDKGFIWFISWFNIVNCVLIGNLLYMEYFMIKVLELSYYFIPLSFIVITASSALAFYLLRNYYENRSFGAKSWQLGILTLASSLIWQGADSLFFLFLALFITGFAVGALSLVEKVELIKCAGEGDKEAYFAFFYFIYPIIAALFIFLLSYTQKLNFNYHLVYLITLFLGIISFALRKKISISE